MRPGARPHPLHSCLLAGVLWLSACPGSNSGGSAQPTTSDPAEDEDGGATPDDSPEEGEATSEGSSTSEGGEIPGPELPTGARCDSTADCAADEVCEGQGCGPQGGRCVTNQRMCTRDLQVYCGCDGQEFESSGSCPGDRFAYRGPCDPQLAVGEACSEGRQCASGLCVGEGLEGCGRGSGGVCADSGTGCTKDLATYCGCNGVEFQASGSCPNQQFAWRGPCDG